MPRRQSYSTYSSYYSREKERRLPSPLPYLVVALIAGAGLGYFHFFAYQSLQGKVTNAYTGAPMRDVLVTVNSSTPAAGGSRSTGGGRYADHHD